MRLTPDEMATLDAALAPEKIAGPRYGPAQMAQVDREGFGPADGEVWRRAVRYATVSHALWMLTQSRSSVEDGATW